MDLVNESEDDQFLKKEEIAEEKAGGMDYEFWHCVPCDKTERLEVKLPKASKCPKCQRKTLKVIESTVRAATTTHAGIKAVVSKCANCGHTFQTQVNVAMLSSSGSSDGGGGSSDSGSSGGSDFGGGSAGGGGAGGTY